MNFKMIVVFCVGAVSLISPALSKPSISSEIESALRTQCDAWNRGDLTKFMTFYLNSPDTSYTAGGKPPVWGYKALEQRYRNHYGTKRDTMGKLKFSDVKTIDLGDRSALSLGRWHLERSKAPVLDGVYSLVWKRTPTGWKIVHDHTSITPPK